MDATWHGDAQEHPLQVCQVSALWVEAFAIRKLLKFVKFSPEENTADFVSQTFITMKCKRKGVDCNDDYFWKIE